MLNPVVDLHSVSFDDSTEPGIPIGAFKRQKNRGGTLTIVGVNGPVRKVFDITG